MSSRLRNAWGQRPIRGLLALLAAITLVACSRDADPTEPPAKLGPSPAVGLSLSPSALSLMIGDEGLLTARAFDANDQTTNATFAWSSADPSVASIDNGTVTAISAGNTTVTVVSGALRATASVAVQSHPAVSVSILPSGLTLIAGEVERLTARAVDSEGQTQSASFEWSSADPAIATVGKSDGLVTAISDGSTTVTATAGTLRGTATVSVVAIAGSLAGSFAFTRTTSSSAGNVTSDVLTFSGADRTPRSLPRPAQFASIAAAAWSTDGTQLAVDVIDKFIDDLESILSYTSDLYVLSAADPAAPWRALTANGFSTSPRWSPDGKRIAYLQQEAVFSYNDIYLIDAGGGAPVRLTRTAGQYGPPRWSPDGTRLVFAAAEGLNSFDIFIVNTDGSGLTNVTRSPAFDYDPSWSPDGSRLAFVSNRDGSSSNVFVVDIDGSNVRRLTTVGGSRGPAWSPDGGQIAFSSGSALYVMNADGSSLARLTTPPLNSSDGGLVWKR